MPDPENAAANPLPVMPTLQYDLSSEAKTAIERARQLFPYTRAEERPGLGVTANLLCALAWELRYLRTTVNAAGMCAQQAGSRVAEAVHFHSKAVSDAASTLAEALATADKD